MCPKSFGGVRFDLGSLLQGQVWNLIPMMDYISLLLVAKVFGFENKIMCSESFVGVRFQRRSLHQG